MAEATYSPAYAEELLGIIMQNSPEVYERAVLIHRVYQLERENQALRVGLTGEQIENAVAVKEEPDDDLAAQPG